MGVVISNPVKVGDGYRQLEDGEVIEAGDQTFHPVQEYWFKIPDQWIGFPNGAHRIRRKLIQAHPMDSPLAG